MWQGFGIFKDRYGRSIADNEFLITVAHESGHPVLASYAYKSTGLSNYSWVHKGSSKGISNGYSSPKEGEKGYENYLGGNADLMKYYIYSIPYSNYHSIEYDIKSLIYLSKITLGN